MTTIHGWEQTAKHAESMGRFLRLKSGESVVVAFCGEPCAIDRVFLDERYMTYDPKLHGGAKKSPRFFLNAFDVAQNAMKIMEGGKPWYEAVAMVKKKYGLEKSVFEVTRTGDGLQTKYAIMYHEALSPDLAARIAQTPLNDLELAIAEDEASSGTEDAKPSGTAAGARSTGAMSNTQRSGEAKIDAAAAEILRKAIAPLSPDLKQAFKETFGVTRLGDIPLAKLDAVRAWIDAQAEL